MNIKTTLILLFVFCLILPPVLSNSDESPLPIRGLHCSVPGQADLPLCLRFIREALPKEGVTHFVLEFDYRFPFDSHPDLVSPSSLSKADIKKIVAACKEAGVVLIPQMNCLGHQSWSKTTFELLTKYPEFDETPGKFPNNENIYCRSYCPLHPKVHDIVFDLIDEMAETCEATDFHVGMDEVFLLGDEDCPRCKGKNKAKLFAYEIRLLHDHLAESNRTMWMWGDRFINGKTTGIGKWEASENETQPAIDLVAKDIVICDWHYEYTAPTAPYFALYGFDVLSCPWRKSNVALGQLELIRSVRKHANDAVAARMKGMLHTTWCGMGPFVKAYYGQDMGKNKAATETAECFKTLFAAIRGTMSSN